MHFVLVFITIVIILWVSVGPVFRYLERKKAFKADEEIRKKDTRERGSQSWKAARDMARKDADSADYSAFVDDMFEDQRIAHDVQYPRSNLNTSFDTETLKGVMKTLRDNAVKEHKENE